ncbi:MAG TPA: glycogen debranching N-terminal domain-containing protein, partial [Gemmatimonadales bacterium]|nr:glycogen debranching N-terminal domain-containing protein [Gemmatimonadales bacterium]
MRFEHRSHVDPHPAWYIVHGGYTVLVTRPDGSFEGQDREGLYDFDTRILSRHYLTIDGQRPMYVGSETVDAAEWHAHLLVPRRGGTPTGPLLPQDVLEVTLARQICHGMLEEVVVQNHSMARAEVELAIELEADFADVLELDGPRRQCGTVSPRWDAAQRLLQLDYLAEHDGRRVERGLRVRIVNAGSDPEGDARRLHFRVALAPGARWAALLAYDSFVDGAWRQPNSGRHERRTELLRRWDKRRAALRANSPLLAGAFERAADDLFALRNWEYDAADDAWVPNAGVPTYTGIFGRDSLAAGWQAAMLSPELMRGALARLAEAQATADSAWRDEEPGKLLHERRRGPLSELDIIPQRAYYGEQTAPAMFVVTLSEYWHWTGDTAALERYR